MLEITLQIFFSGEGGTIPFKINHHNTHTRMETCILFSAGRWSGFVVLWNITSGGPQWVGRRSMMHTAAISNTCVKFTLRWRGACLIKELYGSLDSFQKNRYCCHKEQQLWPAVVRLCLWTFKGSWVETVQDSVTLWPTSTRATSSSTDPCS